MANLISGGMGSSQTTSRSKSCLIRLRINWKVSLETRKVCLNLLSLYLFQTVFHQPRFLGKRRHDRNTGTCWLSLKESRRKINENNFKIDLLLAITLFKMDCCISCHCLLASRMTLSNANFFRSSILSAILDGAIPLDEQFVLLFEFGATALSSTFETTAVLSSCHCQTKFI